MAHVARRAQAHVCVTVTDSNQLDALPACCVVSMLSALGRDQQAETSSSTTTTTRNGSLLRIAAQHMLDPLAKAKQRTDMAMYGVIRVRSGMHLFQCFSSLQQLPASMHLDLASTTVTVFQQIHLSPLSAQCAQSNTLNSEVRLFLWLKIK